MSQKTLKSLERDIANLLEAEQDPLVEAQLTRMMTLRNSMLIEEVIKQQKKIIKLMESKSWIKKILRLN